MSVTFLSSAYCLRFSNVNYNDSLISTYNNIWSIRGLTKSTAIYKGLDL